MRSSDEGLFWDIMRNDIVLQNGVPFVENCSRSDIVNGVHADPGANSVLIQIIDPGGEAPIPKHQFGAKYVFRFADIAAKRDSQWRNALAQETDK